MLLTFSLSLTTSTLQVLFSVVKVVLALHLLNSVLVFFNPFGFYKGVTFFALSWACLRVAAFAMGSSAPVPTSYVDYVCNQLQVIWINTSRILASMVKFLPWFQNFAMDFVTESVSENVFATIAKYSVLGHTVTVLGSMSKPNPAGFCFINLRPKRFVDGEISFPWHVSPPCDFRFGLRGNRLRSGQLSARGATSFLSPNSNLNTRFN